MENKNIVLGKIDKKVCYLNNGQYGYYLSFNKVIIRCLSGCHTIKWTLKSLRDSLNTKIS